MFLWEFHATCRADVAPLVTEGRETQAMRELGAKRYATGHHGKFCISTHPWDEPFANEKAAAAEVVVNLMTPRIGEIVSI